MKRLWFICYNFGFQDEEGPRTTTSSRFWQCFVWSTGAQRDQQCPQIHFSPFLFSFTMKSDQGQIGPHVQKRFPIFIDIELV